MAGGRSSCRACGASDADGWTGSDGGEWSEEEPEEDFDYDSFLEREFGSGELGERRRVPAADPRRLVLWLVIAAFAAALLFPLLL